MSAAERALHFFGRLLVRCFYRVSALGLENIPAGGFLLLPNHITWVDAIVLQFAVPARSATSSTRSSTIDLFSVRSCGW